MKRLTLAVLVLASACGAGVPQAPMLSSVAKMEGALMVTWMNMETGCSSIEGERKVGSGAYAVAFSVPGEVDNKHDTAATSDQTYTYRLRCKKGTTVSAYSAEMSMNPVR